MSSKRKIFDMKNKTQGNPGFKNLNEVTSRVGAICESPLLSCV